MPRTRLELLRWQFDFVWSLLDLHLAALRQDDLLREPATPCWTVHLGEDGRWRPDWADTEPEPIPVPTIAWLTWHIGWWWSVATDHARQRTPRERTEITWPGDAASTVAWLRGLCVEWRDVLAALTEADLDEPAPFPRPQPEDWTVAHMLAWLNGELMKNAAEIGQLRLLHAVRQD